MWEILDKYPALVRSVLAGYYHDYPGACSGDFGQIPGPSSVLFGRAAGAGAGAAFLCHYYSLRT